MILPERALGIHAPLVDHRSISDQAVGTRAHEDEILLSHLPKDKVRDATLGPGCGDVQVGFDQLLILLITFCLTLDKWNGQIWC
jgi:hypothetical protein